MLTFKINLLFHKKLLFSRFFVFLLKKIRFFFIKYNNLIDGTIF